MLVASEISLLLMPASLTLLDYHYLCHKVELQKSFKQTTFIQGFVLIQVKPLTGHHSKGRLQVNLLFDVSSIKDQSFADAICRLPLPLPMACQEFV